MADTAFCYGVHERMTVIPEQFFTNSTGPRHTLLHKSGAGIAEPHFESNGGCISRRVHLGTGKGRALDAT